MRLITGKYGKACIKIVFLFILLLAFNTSVSYGQHIESQIFLSKHELININDGKLSGVYAEWGASNDTYIEVKIFNNSGNSVYLFSSYFDENLYQSWFLHRYNNKTNERILSFLPIPYYMSFKRSDLVVVGEKRVITQFQVIYEFEELAPESYITILIPKESFNSNYVRNYDPKEMNKISKPRFKIINKTLDDSFRKIEFAVYDKINWFNSQSYYYDEYNFDKNSKDYQIISVTIP